MIVVVFVVVSALAVIAGAVGWGWAAGTLFETRQERIDREFERIVARLRSAGS